MSIKVFGHFSPDTDSTCTPIVYAWFLANIRNVEAEAVVTGEINKEAKFVLNKFQIPTPELITFLEPNSQVVIIDTNNPEELLSEIKNTNLLEIIDHHKLVGGLSTSEPLNMTLRKYGCSATIVWEQIKSELPEDSPFWIYALLLASILSDTLKLTSPTTTQNDKQAVSELSKKGNIDIDKYAEELFSAKSDLTGMSSKDILLADSKVFNMGSKKVRVSVLETAKPQNVLSLKEELLTAMRELKETDKLDYLFFYVVDILENSSILLTLTEEEKLLATKAHAVSSVEVTEFLQLPGVVSRKKQIIPNLEKVIN